MNRQEKYIEYIVDHLVKKTEIDYHQEEIKYPFFPPFFNSYLFPPNPFPASSPLFHPLSNHLKEKYGARDEEIKIIWDIYRERILSLIDNE